MQKKYTDILQYSNADVTCSLTHWILSTLHILYLGQVPKEGGR